MLAAHQDAGPSTPDGSLSGKLYRHALDKVAELEPAETIFLESFFEEQASSAASRVSKYAPLTRLLAAQVGDEFILSFTEIESAVGFPLPPSATFTQWWANTVKAHTNVQSEAWRAAGFNAFLREGESRVRFVRT
jgi:hypothetical protein